VVPEDGIVCLDNGMYKIWFARNYRTHVAADRGYSIKSTL
jgi:acetolactate synthase I/II/III large subunit